MLNARRTNIIIKKQIMATLNKVGNYNVEKISAVLGLEHGYKSDTIKSIINDMVNADLIIIKNGTMKLNAGGE